MWLDHAQGDIYVPPQKFNISSVIKGLGNKGQPQFYLTDSIYSFFQPKNISDLFMCQVLWCILGMQRSVRLYLPQESHNIVVQVYRNVLTELSVHILCT